jgi:hypothetical protein
MATTAITREPAARADGLSAIRRSGLATAYNGRVRWLYAARRVGRSLDAIDFVNCAR